MGIGQLQIGTMGWYTTSRTGTSPDGEEIHTLGWLDGVVAAAVSTAKKGKHTNREWPIIPKRSRKKR